MPFFILHKTASFSPHNPLKDRNCVCVCLCLRAVCVSPDGVDTAKTDKRKELLERDQGGCSYDEAGTKAFHATFQSGHDQVETLDVVG